MKQTSGILLSICLVLALLITPVSASNQGMQIGNVDSLTLTGSSAITTPVQTNDAKALAELQNLLASAKAAANPPSATETVATMGLTQGTTTTTITLVRSGVNYYLQRNGEYRSVSYDAFNNLVNTIGSGKVYKFRTPPVAKLDVNGSIRDWSPSQGEYKYRRMSGGYSTTPIQPPESVVRLVVSDGKLPLPTSFTATPVSATVTVLDTNAQQRWQGSLEAAKSYTLAEKGNYTVNLTAAFQTDYFWGEVTYTYALDYGSGVQLTVDGNNTYPGEVVVLRALGVPAGAQINVSTDIDFTPRFFDHPDGSRVALLPVSYFTSVGSHTVTLSYGDVSESFAITTNKKDWQIQNLTVSSETTEETINSQKANAEYEKYIGPLRGVADSKKYWEGKFILPVSDHRVTTQFGMIRYVNGAPTSVRHGAIDLANPTGTPVAATGNGRVLFAGYLQLTGNTVLIEHGFGLKSWYYHMDSLGCKTDDMVKQGDIIGAVGSTGFSTGPHLHFGMSVNKVFINPYTAINTDLLV